MTKTAGTRRMASWVPRLALGLGFLAIGAAKLTGSLQTVETFAAIGWGQWLRYVMGLLDIIAALLVLAPRGAWYRAAAGMHAFFNAPARSGSIPGAHIAGRHFGLADSPKHGGAGGQ